MPEGAPGVLDLWLVRHGATAPNAEKRYPRDDEDAGLSEVGEAQARALARLLPPDALVFTSPARRARDTARRAGLSSARVDDRLSEARFGRMAGRTWAQLDAEYGAAPLAWIEQLADPASPEGPPEGESGRAFHGRVARWLNELPTDGAVVAFTHAGPVRAALRLTLGLSAVDVTPGRAALLRRAGGAWWLVGLNWPAPQA